jgi:endonuclease IV
MPLLGAHMSIAGGCHNALLEARARGCDSVQLFTRSLTRSSSPLPLRGCAEKVLTLPAFARPWYSQR